jgi:hypothetical protein
MGHGIPNGQEDAVKDEVANPDYVATLSSLQQSIATACVVYAYEWQLIRVVPGYVPPWKMSG